MAEGEDEHQDRAGQAVGGAFHRQSRHRAQIGKGIYRRSMDESLFSTEAQCIGFQRVSYEWHAFCIFDSALQEGQGRAGDRTTALRLTDIAWQATEEEDQWWKIMRQVDIEGQLRKMLGPEAQFQGMQEEALGAIMGQESPVVVVIGTGGSKSMLFILPAACGAAAGGLIVVVVLLVSLRRDIKD
ncbi:hypothetical protein C8A05DRAFT_20359 [Staphylotrichum tortipilum]|uniref:Uncharacterized protein n=1 Tax=Staphylotrichum tortipilum TaxID=2831512 RepID=A0AAN6MB45_9PEZI|nr:hypothetical protein C8A05DRAFT_20359 [Staphylotrichum longicolle]